MTAAEIADVFSMPLSTVSAALGREGLGKRSRLAPVEPVNRYQRSRPGELVQLGRIVVPGHAVTGNRRQRAPRTRAGRPGGRLPGTAG